VPASLEADRIATQPPMIGTGDVALAREIARRLYGAEPRVEPIATFRNALLRIALPQGVKVLKLGPAEASDSIRKELLLIQLVSHHGIPVPVVELSDPHGDRFGRPFLVMASAEERTVLDCANEPGDVAARLFGEMGRVQARIHGVRFPASGDIRPHGIEPSDPSRLVGELRDFADRLPAEGIVSPADAALFRGAAMPPAQGLSLCHSDFHGVQCVVAAGRIAAVVDWEAAWAGNPLVDLAFTHAYLDYYGVGLAAEAAARAGALRRAFFAGYASLRPLPPEYARDYLPVRMAHAIGMLRAWPGLGEVAWGELRARGRVGNAAALFGAYARHARGGAGG
jgi:aminoglycoside phosphotransferase (APT) family kinase protein